MKCPKCSYVSFDYNKVCPKCDKDIAAEMEMMNFLSFRPNPPFLLGALIGETGEAMTVPIEIPGGTGAVPQEEGISPGDSQAIAPMEIAFEDSQEVDIQLGPTPGQEAGESLEDVDLSDLGPETVGTELQGEGPGVDLSLDESAEELSLDFEDAEIGAPAEQASEGEITLELDDLEPVPLENVGVSETAVLESSEAEDEELSLDLGGLSLEESEISLNEETLERTEEKAPLELEELDEVFGESAEDFELSVETGQGKDDELSLDLESLDLDLDLEEPDDKSS